MKIEYEDAEKWNLAVRLLISQGDWEELRFQAEKVGHEDTIRREIERIKKPKWLKKRAKEEVFGE